MPSLQERRRSGSQEHLIGTNNYSRDDSECGSQLYNVVEENIRNAEMELDAILQDIIPKPPENLKKDFQEHLRTVKEEVDHQLERLKPLLQPHGLMGYLEDCCHRRMLHHLQSLMKELKGHLEKILQDHKDQKTCDSEEAYVGLHVDVIQCTFTMPEKAKLIDQELSNQVLQVCSQELLTFVKGYCTWQRKFLKNKPETIHFLKTLRTCREIRTHIQKEDMEETVELLNEMETFTKDLLTQVVADDVEKNLQRYFKKQHRQTFPFAALEKHFPRLDFVVDEHKAVMGDIYKAVAHVYFKHLIGTSMRKLRKTWSPDIGTTVHEDAVELHHIISDRAKDVQQCNKLLLSIDEVLTCSDVEGMKVTMAFIQKECNEKSKLLLPSLLLWSGLSQRDVQAVMDALPFPPPIPKRRCWFVQCCCCCC